MTIYIVGAVVLAFILGVLFGQYLSRARLAAKDDAIDMLIRVAVQHQPSAKTLTRAFVDELTKHKDETLGANARLGDAVDTLS